MRLRLELIIALLLVSLFASALNFIGSLFHNFELYDFSLQSKEVCIQRSETYCVTQHYILGKIKNKNDHDLAVDDISFLLAGDALDEKHEYSFSDIVSTNRTTLEKGESASISFILPELKEKISTSAINPPGIKLTVEYKGAGDAYIHIPLGEWES